jgi:serine-protein kinase ATM
VTSFQPYYDLVGGVTAPKAIYCQGSDGRWYKQLVKGPSYAPSDPIPDDLRQDAVMQQAFSLINLLLSLNTQARDRSLKMRTYRVVPLTPAAGVLEWVQGTSPLFEYLVGSAVKVGAEPREVNGAHNRFYPKDRSHASIRSLFSDNAAKSNSHKRAIYRKCCSEFHPVFHNYFLENYPDPLTWYTRRLAYVRSVATSSMIGYIIGLGDRHASNILIDSATAELVHIDLGVAFEQGKQLPVPELVPFRLTRDIVHGMGVSGIHGVFSESCERTMDVMRQQHQFIESIVEVFLHDPLFKWTVSPGRAQRLQRGDLDTEDTTDATKLPATATLDAASTLLRLKQKLVGTEFGDSLSVQGQVRKLVQDAMDEELLSRMFYGWAPWI